MNISMNTLMLAIKAIERDMSRQQALAQNETLTEEEADYHSQYVLDLAQALSELAGLYQAARENHLECPTLDELMKNQ